MLHGLRRQCFLPVTKQNFKFSVTFMLSSANAFNLDKPKNSFQATDCFPTHAHAKDIETVVNVERGKKISERLRA